MIHHGDCLDVMATLDPESVAAIVTDPPYDLTSGKRGGTGTASVNLDSPYGRSRIGTGNGAGGFMGKAWDGTGIAFRPETWALAFAAAKPGAHLLAFGGTRTVHRMTSAIEDAGWEIRDCLVWAYASGFPKSHNLTGKWDGWGTALKPAWEPIVMARKALRGTVAANVLAHGAGALNIDGTRIPGATEPTRFDPAKHSHDGYRMTATGPEIADRTVGLGRWPANVILTDPIFDGGIEGVVGGGLTQVSAPASGPTWEGPSGSPSRSAMAGMGDRDPAFYGDSGTYSRFFLIPKADRADREPIMGHGQAPSFDRSGDAHRTEPADPPARVVSVWGGDEDDLTPGKKSTIPRRNVHPTVKPVDLMRHLVRLVTPPGGLVLDPFLGSGTTGIACEMEGFDWIGIEREAEYVAIAEARLVGVQKGLGLSA